MKGATRRLLLALGWTFIILRVTYIYWIAFDHAVDAQSEIGLETPATATTQNVASQEQHASLRKPTRYVPGPQELQSLINKCHTFRLYDPPPKDPSAAAALAAAKTPVLPRESYEICFFTSLRQILASTNYRSLMTGAFTWWANHTIDGKEVYSGHWHDKGDMCVGFWPRSTWVQYLCEPGATEPKFVFFEEYDVCRYKLTMVLPEWCEVEAKGITAPRNVSPPRAK